MIYFSFETQNFEFSTYFVSKDFNAFEIVMGVWNAIYSQKFLFVLNEMVEWPIARHTTPKKKTHHTLCGDRSFISKVAQNELHVFVFDLQYSLQLETSKTGYHTLFCPDNETFSQWNTLIPFIYSSDWIIDNSHVIAYAIYAHTQKNLRQNFQKFGCAFIQKLLFPFKIISNSKGYFLLSSPISANII